MDATIETKLKSEAKKAGIIDEDALRSPLFSKTLDGLTSVDDVPGAINEMRKIKPKWFASSFTDAMSKGDFDKAEAALREHTQQVAPPVDDVRELLSKIDASQLDDANFAAYELAVASVASSGVLRSFVDRAAIRKIAAAQGVNLKQGAA